MVLPQIYFLASSLVANGFSSRLRESLRIFQPSNDHKPIVSTVTTAKKFLFKKPFLKLRIGSCFTCSVSVQ